MQRWCGRCRSGSGRRQTEGATMTKAIERGRTVARNASDTPRLSPLNPTGTLSTLETAPAIFLPPNQFHAKNFSFAAWVVQYYCGFHRGGPKYGVLHLDPSLLSKVKLAWRFSSGREEIADNAGLEVCC